MRKLKRIRRFLVFASSNNSAVQLGDGSPPPTMGTSTETGDFTGKQFSEKEVASKVQEQYGEAHARTFYKVRALPGEVGPEPS